MKANITIVKHPEETASFVQAISSPMPRYQRVQHPLIALSEKPQQIGEPKSHILEKDITLAAGGDPNDNLSDGGSCDSENGRGGRPYRSRMRVRRAERDEPNDHQSTENSFKFYIQVFVRNECK